MKKYKCNTCDQIVTLEELQVKKGGIVNKMVYCEEHFNELAKRAALKTKAMDRKEIPAQEPSTGSRTRTRDRVKSGTRRTRRIIRQENEQKVPKDSEEPEKGKQEVEDKEAGALEPVESAMELEEEPLDDSGDAETNEQSASSKQKIIIIAFLGLIVVLLITVVMFLLVEPVQEEEAARSEIAETEAAEKQEDAEQESGSAEKEEPAEEKKKKLQEEYDAVLQQCIGEFDGSIKGFNKGRRVIEQKIIGDPLFRNSGFIAKANEMLAEKEEQINIIIGDEFASFRKEIESLMSAYHHKDARKKAEEFPQRYRTFGKWADEYKGLMAFINDTADDQLKSWIDEAQKKVEDKNIKGALTFFEEMRTVTSGEVFDRITGEIDNKIAALKKLQESIEKGGAQSFAQDPDIYFWEDFEEGMNKKTLTRGILHLGNNLRGSKRCAKGAFVSGGGHAGAFKLSNYNDEEGLFTAGDEPYVSFWYYIDTPVRYLNPNLKRIIGEETTSFDYDMRRPVVGTWTFFMRKLSLFIRYVSGDKEKKSNPLKEGDRFVKISIAASRQDKELPPQDAGMLIDNVAVTRGVPLYMFPDIGSRKDAFIRKVTLNTNEHFSLLDLGMLINLKQKIGEHVDRQTVMLAGGRHATSSFLEDFKRFHKDIKLVKTEKSGRKKVFIEDLSAYLEKGLEKYKPAVTVIIVGTNDIIHGKDTVNAGAAFFNMANACLKHGSIPVLCTIPFMTDNDLTNNVTPLNAKIVEAAKKANIPYLDIYRALTSGSRKPQSYISGKYRLSSKGYKEVNAVFERIYSVFEEALF